MARGCQRESEEKTFVRYLLIKLMPRLGHDTILGGKTTSDKFHHPVSQSNKCFPIVLPPLKLSKNHHSSNYNSWSRSFLLKSAILLKTYARLDIGGQVYFTTTRLLHSSLNFFIVSALCVGAVAGGL